MRPTTDTEALMWLEQAESDFSSLDILFKAEKHDLVCFLSQQVAEKALKAYLLFHEEESVHSKSNVRLCDMGSKFDKDLPELKKKIKNLSPYYVETRYPDALEEIPARFFDNDDAKKAIDMAKHALEFVKEKMKK